MQDLDISLVQTELDWHDPAANRARFTARLPVAGAAELVLLPEMFNTGFTMDSGTQTEPMAGTTLTWLRAQARERHYAIAGSLAVQDRDKYFNRFCLATADGRLHCYDKRHRFRMTGEHQRYSAGEDRGLLTLHGWRLQPQICYDLRFPVFCRNAPLPEATPENPALLYDVLIFLANWPALRASHWRTLLAARAIENQCYVVGLNRIGMDGNGIAYQGDSMVLGPTGAVLLDLGDRDEVGSVRLDAAALLGWRREFPAWLDAD